MELARPVGVVLCLIMLLLRVPDAASGQGSSQYPPEPSSAASVDAWLRTVIQSAGCSTSAGRYTFVLASFTGNIVTDPDHADAVRRLASVWLNRSIVSGDAVRVAGIEHGVWYLSESVEIDDGIESRRRIFSLWPVGPSPQFRGGKNIEASLSELAQMVRPERGRGVVLIVCSNSWSQARRGAKTPVVLESALHGRSYGPVAREVFGVRTPRAARAVYVAACARCPEAAAGGTSPRNYYAGARPWVPAAYAMPDRAARDGHSATIATPASEMPWMLVLSLAALAVVTLGGIGYLVIRHQASGYPTRYGDNVATPEERPAFPPASKDPASALVPELATILEDAGKHLATLRVFREEMQEAVARIGSAEQMGRPADACGNGAEIGTLRAHVVALQQQLEEWDQTAIAYMDALEEAVRHPDLPEASRRVWMKAATDFCRKAQAHGFARIAPSPGDPYVPALHRATECIGDPQKPLVIDECLHWGYQNGTHVYRLAQVRVRESVPHE